jgi:hypothetical protein
MRTILVVVQVVLGLIAGFMLITAAQGVPSGSSFELTVSYLFESAQFLLGVVLFVISWGLWEMTRYG